jgi:MFS family permease
VVVYGLAEAGRHGGFADKHVVLPLVAGVALLAAYAWHALRTTIEPIIDLRLFKARSFAASSAVLFIFGMAMFGAMLLLPLYYQQVRGDSAVRAGLLVAPQGVGLAVALILAGRLADRMGPRWIALTGLILACLGTIPFGLVKGDGNQLLLGASLVVRGAGLGAALVPCMAAAYRGLPERAITRASSAVRIFQQLGGSFGVAVVAVLLQRRTEGVISAAGGHPSPDQLAGAFGSVFWWTVAFAAVAVIPALLLPRTLHDDIPGLRPPPALGEAARPAPSR